MNVNPEPRWVQGGAPEPRTSFGFRATPQDHAHRLGSGRRSRTMYIVWVQGQYKITKKITQKGDFNIKLI